MPLLQGQPFKLIKPPDIYPVDDEVHVIQHTGEKFLNKSDYEDRLALYSQSIWTCQCTGRSGLTHQEAWTSEAKVRVAAMTAVPLSLQKPLLTLVHHSLSPLEQLIDAASILCYSQYHVGEELTYLNNPKSLVRIINSKEGIKRSSIDIAIDDTIANGIASQNNSPAVNGATNGLCNADSPGSSPGKENQAKDLSAKEENGCRKEMLPKLYDILVLEDNTLIENVSTKQLQRPYKLPSKDQIRLFIRSCALRHRGTTCTPWVVSDDLIDKFSIPNKLPTVFLSSPKPKPNSSLSKRKAHSPAGDSAKRTKSDQKRIKPIISSGMCSKVAPLVLKSGNLQKSIFNIVNPELGMLKAGSVNDSSVKLMSPEKLKSNTKNEQSTSPFRVPLNSLSKSHQSFLPKSCSPQPFNHITKHPLSLGKPKMLHKSFSLPSKSSPTSAQGSPRKRGRPSLTKEEKERNKKLREAALLDFSKKATEENADHLLKIKTHSMMLPPESSAITPYLQTGNPSNPFYSASPYKSPVNRATTSEAVMKLPFMRRYVYEFKTIKGVIGQFRRLAHTMDVVLAKLSPEQIEMIPDDVMKQDLYARQKKVRDKKFIEQMTPEEKKQYMRDKARTTALERWKERKLKNLKIEDKTLNDLKTLPKPILVTLPKPLPNSAFGDVVMITEFLKCFRELLLGEEKFLITCCQLMEALIAGSHGFKLIVDILCYLLPTIIHDDDSKNCKTAPKMLRQAKAYQKKCFPKELGVNISTIPINFQTAPELARLCLRKQENYCTVYQMCDESEQIGMEQTELSDDLLTKLEKCEFWELEFHEIIAVIKALVHKVLSTASLSVFVEEMEEKVLRTLRERRKFLKHLQKSKLSEQLKKKEERIMNKEAKNNKPKKQRGRPKGYSPKLAGLNLQEYLKKKKEDDDIVANSISGAVFKRRTSSENNKKERAEQKKIEQERLKQQEEEQKKLAWDKKYDDIILKKDNLLRCTPIGYDRNHNRYWIFHTSNPGLYVEKGWVDYSTNYRISPSMENGECSANISLNGPKEELEPIIKSESSDDEKPLSIIMKSQEEEEDKPLSTIKKANEDDEDNKPLSFVKSKLEEQDEDNKSLATIKSKLSISPMKMTCRGRPPKEAYVLVDEDTQTFPTIGENMWFYYKSMEDVQNLYDCLTDKGHRESQLRAAISLNMERLQRLFISKSEPVELSDDTPNHLKQSLKEDIAQIERELIEGWLGGITEFDQWEKDVLEADSVSTLGPLLIEAQKHMQLKYLKGLMAPEKKQLPVESPDAIPEFEDVEGLGVQKWRDAVLSCKTYSRLHVLVGLFDSCIKWEKSMATRKCRICRSKMKDDPLLMCDKCENSFHWYCLRPPLKEEPGENWLCPACMPKKTRREESTNNSDMTNDDPEEKDDPTFAINKQGRIVSSGRNCRSKNPIVNKKLEKQCEVCYGRIGLISCCKCSAAYHSECHDPPLLSRARKDWACGKCSNSKSNSQRCSEDVGFENEPRYRRNIFSNEDDTNKGKDQKPRIAPPRGRMGRFVKQDGLAIAMSAITEDGPDNISAMDEHSNEETTSLTTDRFGRSVRGAKVKALEIMTGDEGSRRSSRNVDKKTKYQYDSDEEGSDEEDEGEMEEDETNKEMSGEEDDLCKEVNKQGDQNGEENSDVEAVDIITLEDTDGDDLKSSDNGNDSDSDDSDASEDSNSNSTNGNEESKNISGSPTSSDQSDDSDSSQSDVEDISKREEKLTLREG